MYSNLLKFSKAPRRSGVAPFTTREIVTAERALTVVTSHATLAPSRRVMVERLGRGDLSPLRLACTHIVTFVACHLFVLRVTKTDTECRHHRRRARIAA
jgi:hypothetical protein